MRKSVTVREYTHPKYTHRVRYPGPAGKPLSAYFTSETKALAFAKKRQRETGESGKAFGSLSSGERRAVDFWREFAGDMKDTPPPEMLEVLQKFAARWRADKGTVTIERAVSDFLEARKDEGISAAHQQSLKTRCERFAADFAGRKLATIRTSEISKWTLGLKTKRTGEPASATTKRNHRLAVSNLFTYAKSEGWVDENPVTEARKPKKPDFAPEILSPALTKTFLHAVEKAAPDILPFWSVRVFAGVRRSEAEKIDWQMIDLTRNEMNLPARITKTNRPRTVAIRPALKAFLEPFAKDEGRIYTHTEGTFRGKMKTVRDELPKGFVIPDNFARHGFGTYHALQFRHAGETALEMGHGGDPEILFAHYTAESNDKAAKAFWAIRPKKFASVKQGRKSA